MARRLQIKIAKAPDPHAAVAARQIHPSKRMMREIFGTTAPRHTMAVLLPGSDAASVEVRVTDDLMAVADAVGVTASGGEQR